MGNVRRVDSCGSLDFHRRPSPVMPGGRTAYDHTHDHTHFPQAAGGEKMRRTKSASTTAKPHKKRDNLKSRSPPARQPSPLVTDSQQPVYQVLQHPTSPQEPEPIYHTLQQPGSPQQPPSPLPPISPQLSPSPGPPQLPAYEVLQVPPLSSSTGPVPYRQPPVYQVLQQPDNSSLSAFQGEAFQPIHGQSSRQRGKGLSENNAINSSQPHFQPVRAATPHHEKHCILDTQSPAGVPPSSSKGAPPQGITSKVKMQRCGTVPTGYIHNTTESLV